VRTGELGTKPTGCQVSKTLAKPFTVLSTYLGVQVHDSLQLFERKVRDEQIHWPALFEWVGLLNTSLYPIQQVCESYISGYKLIVCIWIKKSQRYFFLQEVRSTQTWYSCSWLNQSLHINTHVMYEINYIQNNKLMKEKRYHFALLFRTMFVIIRCLFLILNMWLLLYACIHDK
jgi:hypothetical protein